MALCGLLYERTRTMAMSYKKLRTVRVDGMVFCWRYNERCRSLVLEPRWNHPYVRVVLHFPPLAYCSHLCNPLYLTPHDVARLTRDGLAIGWPTSRKTGLYRAWFALMEERLVEISAEACGSRGRKRNENEALRAGRGVFLQILAARQADIHRCSEQMAECWEGVLFGVTLDQSQSKS